MCNRGVVLDWIQRAPTRGEVSGNQKQEPRQHSPSRRFSNAVTSTHLDLQNLPFEAYSVFPAVILRLKLFLKKTKQTCLLWTPACQTISSAMNFEWKWLPKQNSVPPLRPWNILHWNTFIWIFQKDLCLNIDQGDKDVETVRW